MAYVLGAVKPNVKKAAEDVDNRFQPSNILGVGFRPNESDHPKGLALDFMIGTDSAKGDAITAFMQQNYSHYGVTYIIWKQRIWSSGRSSEGWRSMPDRGSVTANHYDHVHVSFQNRSVAGSIGSLLPNIPGPVGDAASAANAIKEVAQAANFLTDSHNWLRVGMFVLGFLLVLIAVAMLGVNAGVKPATVKKVVKNVRSVRARNA